MIVAKAFHGQRYPMPLSVCENEMMRGAAAPKGPMTYDSTKGNFLWFEELLWGAERPDFGFERCGLGSEMLDLGSERPDLGSEWPVLRSERPDLGSERPNYGS